VFLTLSQKFRVIPREFQDLLGVIFKFDLLPSEIVGGSECHGKFHLPLFLPALIVALDVLPLRDGLAYGVHKPHSALAVVPYLRLTRSVHLTVTRGVATLLAPMLAIL
jgi:hypothetical protein